jgi:3-deoxy-D-manno-octulosonic-acid transferase
LLIDTTGELADFYNIATIVFIGKSMTARGGQNPVEAIVAGKPVIFGPHMENFEVLSHKLLKQGGALAARHPDELVSLAGRIFRDLRLRETITAQATRVLAPHRGATARTADLIDALH